MSLAAACMSSRPKFLFARYKFNYRYLKMVEKSQCCGQGLQISLFVAQSAKGNKATTFNCSFDYCLMLIPCLLFKPATTVRNNGLTAARGGRSDIPFRSALSPCLTVLRVFVWFSCFSFFYTEYSHESRILSMAVRVGQRKEIQQLQRILTIPGHWLHV